MPRVALEILRGKYEPALSDGLDVPSCRLLTDLSLRSDKGWLPFRPAVIDTGAPLSLLPRNVWHGAHIRDEGSFAVNGIIRKPACKLEVVLATVTVVIRDPVNQIGPIQIQALLSESNDVPTLLGMRGILDQLILHTDVTSDYAYLEAS